MAEMTTFELRLAEALSEYAGPKVEIDYSSVARRAAAAPAPPTLRWTSWRPALSMTVAVVGVFAVVALALLFFRSTLPPAVQGSPSPQPTASPIETLAPTPGLSPTSSPRIGREGNDLEPGRYSLYGPVARISTGWPESVSLEIPAGWTQGSPDRNVGFTRYSDPESRTPLAIIAGSSVEWIPGSACQGSVATRIGKSVSDLTDALRALSPISVSQPTPVTVDSYGGLLVTVEVPDMPECEVATFWQGPVERDRESSVGASPRGWSNDIYVLDVDGTRWVLQAAFAPSATDDVRAEVQEMVESVDIAGPTGPRLADLDMPRTAGSGPGWFGCDGRPNGGCGMHWVVGDEQAGYREAAEMGFLFGSNCLITDGNPDPLPVQIGELEGIKVFPYEPAWNFGGRDGDEITHAYALDVEGRTLCVFVTVEPTTTQKELETAEAIVDSILAAPLGEDGIRIIFEVAEGVWDTG